MPRQTDKNLVKLARIIFELVLHEDNKKTLDNLSQIASRARYIFQDRDDAKKTLHADLGFDLSTFTTFKREANDGAYRDYRENTCETIEWLEDKYDITYSPSIEPHRTDKNLTKLARVLYELILHEEDLKVLFSLFRLSQEAKVIFDDHFTTRQKVIAELGYHLEEFAARKIEANENETTYHLEDAAYEAIEQLEKEYGLYE